MVKHSILPAGRNTSMGLWFNGRALPLHRRCRGFESRWAHQRKHHHNHPSACEARRGNMGGNSRNEASNPLMGKQSRAETSR